MKINFSKFRKEDQHASKIFHVLKDKVVLEVGCASGENLDEFARTGCECFGVEIVKPCCIDGQRTRRRNMVVADACHLPFRTESFDFVFSNEAMSHFTDITSALHEQCRVLQREGQLLIRDGNPLCPFVFFDLLILYPLRTRGKYGGLKWLFTCDQIKENTYGSGPTMKDENIKTLLWWKKEVRQLYGLKLELATTSYTQYLPKLYSGVFELFAGQNIILLRKEKNTL